MVVEAPRTDLLAYRDHFRRVARVGELRHHAVESGDWLRNGLPFAAVVTRPDRRALAVYQQRRRPQQRAAPDAFALYHRVERKRRLLGRGQAEIHRIAKLIAGKAEPQIDRLAAARALHRLVARQHAARETLGTGPERRRQTAFARQRANHATARRLRQQAQGAIHAGLAASVRPGDDIQRAKRHN